jgi:hypothetical protein
MFALFLATFLVGCGNANHYPGANLAVEAGCLKYVEKEWVNRGRPTNFNIVEYIGPSNVFFVFTNTVTNTSAVFHCCFAARRPDWPAGLLAVTDNGIALWVRDRDGKVTMCPENCGVEP